MSTWLAACEPAPCDEVRVAGAGELVVCVERARTAAERQRGLVGRRLGDGEGLLFEFPVEGEVCLTNEGVAFAIDALWFDGAGRVSAVERGLPPGDAGPWCHAPAAYVLEVEAGVAAGVEVGDALTPIPRRSR